jgi:PAS domain S-box-containing protein
MPLNQIPKAYNYQFLQGGGEMGELIRSIDWSATPIGAVETWPQSLRIAISIILSTPFPMYIAWGNEYTQFYNDGYRPILGSTKHPQAMGISTRDTFSEIWHIVGLMFSDVMKGKPIWAPNFMYLLERNGFPEECYFDFSYSPIYTENNDVGGVLVTVIETTEKFKYVEAVKEKNNELQFVINAANLATWDLNAVTKKFTANHRFLEWFGLEKKPVYDLEEAMNRIIAPQRAQAYDEMNKALTYSSTGDYEISFTIRNPAENNNRILRVKGKVIVDENRVAQRFSGTLDDITKGITAHRALLKSEENLRNLVLNAPVAMAVFSGPQYVVEIANVKILELWGKTQEQVMDKPVFEGLPELKSQGIDKLLFNVYTTGERFIADELTVDLFRNGVMQTIYVNFVYEALKDANNNIYGIAAVAVEVTEQINARQRVEEAEERTRLAINAADMGTFDLNIKTSKFITSSRYDEMMGFSETAEHQAYVAAIHPDDLPIRNEAFKTAIETGKLSYIARILKEEEIIWMQSYGQVYYDAPDKPARSLGAVLDITRQQHILQELKASEEQLRLATSAAELGTFDMNLVKGTMEWDNRCRELFGISHNDAVSYEKDFLQGLHEDDRERIGKIIDDLFNKSISNGDYDVEYRTIGVDDKKLRWLRAKGKVFFNEKDEAVRFIGSVFEITDQKQDELRKNDFIAMVSHELKTPLTSLKAYVQLLNAKAKKENDNLGMMALGKTEIQVNKMTAMINGFLDVSRLESGKIIVDKRMFNLAELARDIIDEIILITPAHTINLMPCEPLTVFADSDKIGYVINNFLSNAAKYSPKSKFIEVRCELKGDTAEVSVKDEGMGIKQHHIDKVFDRYFRVENKHTKQISGFGIGLYLCAEIIKRHNGKIWVQSESGKGSTFYFSIPLSN